MGSLRARRPVKRHHWFATAGEIPSPDIILTHHSVEQVDQAPLAKGLDRLGGSAVQLGQTAADHLRVRRIRFL